MLKIRIHALPVSDCRDDAERDDLVTHLAEMCIRSVESSEFLSGTLDFTEVNASLVNDCRHSHHHVLILLVVYVSTCRPGEFLTTHCSGDHLHRIEGRALE